MYHAPGIQNFTGVQTWTTDRSNYAIGSSCHFDFWWSDDNSIVHKAKIKLGLFRCVAAISGAGIPVMLTYSATYGLGVTGTYAAALLTDVVGITISATSYAAGDGIWVQTVGPNYQIMVSTGAIAIGGGIQHNTAGTSVKAEIDADNRFATLQGTAIGGAGNIPVGAAYIGHPSRM